MRAACRNNVACSCCDRLLLLLCHPRGHAMPTDTRPNRWQQDHGWHEWIPELLREMDRLPPHKTAHYHNCIPGPSEQPFTCPYKWRHVCHPAQVPCKHSLSSPAPVPLPPPPALPLPRFRVPRRAVESVHATTWRTDGSASPSVSQIFPEGGREQCHAHPKGELCHVMSIPSGKMNHAISIPKARRGKVPCLHPSRNDLVDVCCFVRAGEELLPLPATSRGENRKTPVRV